jgi:hypothetical protein
MSLHLFFDNLRKAHQIEGLVAVVVDNAQLTRENRMRASQSFTPLYDHETGRRPCRWSSNPTLIRRSSESSIASHKTAFPLKSKSGMQNASWETFKQTTSSLPPMHSSLPERRASHSPTASSAQPSQGQSLRRSISFTAPKLPERFLSPASRRDKSMPSMQLMTSSKSMPSMQLMTSSKVKRGDKKKSTSSRKSSNSLLGALGAMAPTTTTKNKKNGLSSSKSLRDALGAMAPTTTTKNKMPSSKRFTNTKDPQLQLRW